MFTVPAASSKKITQNLRWLVTLLTMIVCAGAWAAEETFDFSAQNYTNQQEIGLVEATNFTVSFNKGTNSNTPKYYTTGTAIRAYGGNTFTVSSSNTITKITLTFGSGDGSNAISTDVGSFDSPDWTGSANSITFTIGGTSGHRRIKGITVTFNDGGTVTKTLTSIAISGTHQNQFYVGDTFNHEGAVVTATFSQGLFFESLFMLQLLDVNNLPFSKSQTAASFAVPGLSKSSQARALPSMGRNSK